MTTKKRKSEQRNVSGATPLANFLLGALHDDAIIDNTLDVLFEHVKLGRFTPEQVTEYLRFSIQEALGTAAEEDWRYVTDTLIADARETLKGEPSSASACTPPQQNADPGEMREELGHIHAQDVVSPRGARQAWTLIRNFSRLVGISRAKVRVNAREDAEAVRTVDEYDAVRASRSSGQNPASSEEPVIEADTPPVVAAYQILRHLAEQGGAVDVEDTRGKTTQGWVTGVTTHEVSVEEIRTRENVYIRLADIENMEEIEAVFVKPLSRHETSYLLDTGESSQSWKRKRAAIILASNFGNTVAEIAATQKVEAWFVRRVIVAFNDCGLKSLGCSTPTTITLDTDQFNLLISGLGLARLALNDCGGEYIGFAWEYTQLADEIVAQSLAMNPAPRAARERLSIQEGRATSIRKPS